MNKFRILVWVMVAVLILFPCVAYCANAVPAEVLDVRESLVRVFSTYDDGFGSGTGFAIGKSSPVQYVATNYHVVKDSPKKIEVWQDKYNYVEATIFQTDRDADLCILKLDKSIDLAPVTIEDINDAKAGDAIYALGFPGAADSLSEDFAVGAEEATITDGIISSLKRGPLAEEASDIDLLQINAAISSGNSGGPLLNEDGHVIGINTLTVEDAQNINAAVSAKELVNLIGSCGISYKVNEVQEEPDVNEEAKENEEPEEAVAAISQDNNESAIQSETSSFPWILVISIVAAVIIAILVLLLLRKNRGSSDKGMSVPFAAFFCANHITIEQKLYALLPLFKQVEVLHKKGRTNLNISPESITVQSNKALFNYKQKSKKTILSPAYGALELFKTDMPKGTWTDVYALSAILYQILNGYAPTASYERTDTPVNFSQELDAKYSQLKDAVVCGLALDPGYRKIGLDEIIIQIQTILAAYQPDSAVSLQNTSTDGNMLPGQYDPSAKKRPINKKVILIPVICVAALGLITGGLYLYIDNNYTQAASFIDRESFVRAESSLQSVPQFYKDSEQMSAYTQAAMLLQKENFEQAKEEFECLGDYKDSPDKVLESSYYWVEELLDNGDYKTAKELLKDLSGYKDAENLTYEADYIKVQEWLEEGKLDESEEELNRLIELGFDKAKDLLPDVDYRRALEHIDNNKKFDALKILLKLDEKYKDTEQILETLKEDVYEEAAAMIRKNSIGSAAKRFKVLSGYRETDDYVELVELLSKVKQQYRSKFTRSNYERMVSLKHLFNIDDYYMQNGAIFYFLEGRWKDSSGNYFTLIYENDNWSPYFNMPSHKAKYYDILDRVFTSFKEKGDYVGNNDLRFEYVDENTIKIYCYKNKETYTLTRQ